MLKIKRDHKCRRISTSTDKRESETCKLFALAKAFNMESHENWTKKLIQFGLNIHALLWFEECSKALGKQLSSKYQTRLKCLVRYHRDLY